MKTGTFSSLSQSQPQKWGFFASSLRENHPKIAPPSGKFTPGPDFSQATSLAEALLACQGPEQACAVTVERGEPEGQEDPSSLSRVLYSQIGLGGHCRGCGSLLEGNRCLCMPAFLPACLPQEVVRVLVRSQPHPISHQPPDNSRPGPSFRKPCCRPTVAPARPSRLAGCAWVALCGTELL